MSFSAYLVGTWEKRYGLMTTIQIINPTVERLFVTVAFLDNRENFIECEKFELSANDLKEILIPKLEDGTDFGVVKAISHTSSGEVKDGIVGFKRHFLIAHSEKEVAFSEAPLAAVPMEFARPEFDRFQERCPHE